MAAYEKRFQRRCNLGTIAMNLKVIWKMSDKEVKMVDWATGKRI
jgi:hypothetical protein